STISQKMTTRYSRLLRHVRLPFVILGLLTTCLQAQEFLHVAGEDFIGAEILTAIDEGGELVARVPNTSGTWSTDGGEGIVSSDLSSPIYTVTTAGEVTLSFDHRYHFEDDGITRRDGGAVFIRINGEPTEYVEGNAFSQNGYDGFGAAGDGRTITGNCPPIGAAEPDGKFGFNGASAGFADGDYIESLVSLGTFEVGDTISVTFVGAWDEGFVQTPSPNWDIASFSLADTGATLADLKFADGAGIFTVSSMGDIATPWNYAGTAFIVFETDTDDLSADRYVADPAGPDTFIDLNGANLIVQIESDELEVGDRFTLFEGGTMRGNYASIALPEGQWDLSGLASGGDGIITYASNALPGWLVRNLDVVGGTGSGNVDSLTEADGLIANTGTANFTLQGDRTEVRPILDLGGGAGDYPVNDLYPGSTPTSGTTRDDFVIFATSQVTIPAGTWSIAIASDDGGSIKVEGVDFSTGAAGVESRFGEEDPPLRLSDDSVRFDAKRGHGWTGGTFVLTEPLSTTVTAVMFERGGGDSIEVAVRDATSGIDNAPQNGAASGWALLEDGLNGWTLRTGTTTADRGEAIHVGGLNSIRPESVTAGDANLRNPQYGPAVTSPGLTQEWWQLGNPATKEGMDVLFAGSFPDVGPFKGSENGGSGTWWTGSGNAIPGILDYPPSTGALRRNRYITRLTGEIFIPESGTIRFKDGVDDFIYLAIDLNNNGTIGALDDGTGQSEILVNDTIGTDVESSGNRGSPIAERTFSVAAGGEWLAVEVNIGEGSGGDNGVLYWDHGAGVGFPTSQADSIDLANDAAALLVPEANLRSSITPLLSADLIIRLETDIPYEFEIMADGTSDTLSITPPNPETFNTVLDLVGAHIKVIFPGEAPELNTTFNLFAGATIEGNYASLTLPPGDWDTRGLEPGGDGSVTLLDGILFEITSITFEDEANTATLTFNSRDRHRYAIEHLIGGLIWEELVDDIDAVSNSTSFTETGIPAATERRIYRVIDLGIQPDP
ncbi:MAG: hypothetical protein ACI9NC_006243, partial [Verrucomicrobiales bacterium]